MKGKSMLAMGFRDLFQEGNGKSLQLLQVAVPFLPSLFCPSARQLSKVRR
jgi:hypothetical protein